MRYGWTDELAHPIMEMSMRARRCMLRIRMFGRSWDAFLEGFMHKQRRGRCGATESLQTCGPSDLTYRHTWRRFGITNVHDFELTHDEIEFAGKVETDNSRVTWTRTWCDGIGGSKEPHREKQRR